MSSGGASSVVATDTTLTFYDVNLSSYESGSHQIYPVYVSDYGDNGGYARLPDAIEGEIISSSTSEAMKILKFTGLKPSTTYYVYGYIMVSDTYMPLNLSGTTKNPPAKPALYASQNGKTKKITSLIGTHRITKLYGSVEGKTKLIARFWLHKTTSGGTGEVVTPPTT